MLAKERNCTKKTTVCICILSIAVLLAVLLIPTPMYADDGGSVKYQAVLYSVYDVHSMAADKDSGFREGIIVEILGMEVFNNVK